MEYPIALKVRRYHPLDDPAALELERSCIQGRSLAVRFRRSSFAARSAVYSDSTILCGWVGTRLIGTVAAARKDLTLHGQALRAAYFYDLRVHPEFRGRGVVHQLLRPIVEMTDADGECSYVLVAGQNERMLGLLRGHYRAEVAIHLTYLCLPVMRTRHRCRLEQADPFQVRSRYIDLRRPTFIPAYEPGLMAGYVGSVVAGEAGCSVWSNEEILAEEIVRLPAALRAFAAACRACHPFAALPSIPRIGECVRSWFLYDVYAESEKALHRLIAATNEYAADNDRDVLYLLLRSDDPYLTWARHACRWAFSFPYRFLARGERLPATTDPIYIDVRDL